MGNRYKTTPDDFLLRPESICIRGGFIDSVGIRLRGANKLQDDRVSEGNPYTVSFFNARVPKSVLLKTLEKRIDSAFAYALPQFSVAEVAQTICGRNNGLAKIGKKSHPSAGRITNKARGSIEGWCTCHLYALYFQIKVSIKLKSGILIAALKNI